jgi:integrase
MKTSFKSTWRSDPEIKNLSWRSRKDGMETPVWRQLVDGKPCSVKLAACAAGNRAKLRSLIREHQKTETWQATLRGLGLGKEKHTVPEPVKCATFGELFKAYEEWSAGQKFASRTVGENIQAMERLLHGARGEDFDVKGANVEIFTVKLLHEFAHSVVSARRAKALEKKWDAEKTKRGVESAERTVYATIHQARSLFKGAALDSAQYEPLHLPDLGRALKASVGKNTLKTSWFMPPMAVVKRILEDSTELRKTDPAAWLGMQLECLCGTRRGSVVDAKWAWFTEQKTLEGTAMFLEVRRAKGAQSVIRLNTGDWEALKAARADVLAKLLPDVAPEFREKQPVAEFVLPGIKRSLRERIMAFRLVPWLRERGLTEADGRRLPNHELRKIWATMMNRTGGHDNLMLAAAWSDEKLKWAYTERGAAVGLSMAQMRQQAGL